MRQINVFNFATMNGFFKGPGGDISWAHRKQDEAELGHEGLDSDNILLFGRVTYQMMSSYWPTPMAAQNDAKMAAGMNKAEKIVFSNTLNNADWSNSRVMGGDIVGQIRNMRKQPGKNMTILGSGSIVTQFAEAGLIDSIQLLLHPVALGKGTSLFDGLKQMLTFDLQSARAMKSGAVLLTYTKSK